MSRRQPQCQTGVVQQYIHIGKLSRQIGNSSLYRLTVSDIEGYGMDRDIAFESLFHIRQTVRPSCCKHQIPAILSEKLRTGPSKSGSGPCDKRRPLHR
ncbi:hypothetical protein D3OALGB2SA_2300 [Olavius algarvensis associated proteobacterium Delta 3]|nr:hypothetical protein D3OALGB2SA_2300 [Olavius algarvensis associated proteobacterium Delta 3]